MPHVDDGQLNALLDGELPEAEAREVQAHLAGCAECARRLEEARSFLTESGELLAVLEPGAPAASDLVPAPPVAVTPGITRKEQVPLVAPLARGPADSDSTRKLDRETGPRLKPTAKEVAVSVDGRTGLTSAIRPVARAEVPAPPRRKWQAPDLEKMAWAASLILCLGVGYLANEVKNLRRDKDALALQVPASPAPATTAEPATAARTSSSQPRRSAGGAASAPRQTATRSDAHGTSGPLAARTAPASDGRFSTGVSSAKPRNAPATKPPPTFAQRPADGLAANTSPLAGAGNGATSQPPPAAPAQVLGQFADRTRSARTNALDEASVAPGTAAPSAATGFRRITIEEAVRRLSGTIRLIDGMQPTRVEAGPGSLVPGASPDHDVVRVTYSDRHGPRLVLDQQIGDVHTGSFNGLMQGDTLVTATDGGGTRVRWVDRKFWLSLTAALESDSLRSLVGRVR